MYSVRAFCFFAASLMAVVGFAAIAPGEPPLKIFVDPEVRVSYDGDVPHMEAPVAASATEQNLLYAAAEVIFPGRPMLGGAAQLYYSHDAGAQWTLVELPAESEGGWDNALAAGAGQTAYFITHGTRNRVIQNGLIVYRTRDGGRTWTSSSIAGEWDREYAAVDHSGGPYSGRLYIAGTGPPKTKGQYLIAPHKMLTLYNDLVDVVSSSDGGKTFTPQRRACPGFMTEPSPMVLSDGTLVVSCAGYDRRQHYDFHGNFNYGTFDELFGIVTSKDGGTTFSPFHPIGRIWYRETAALEQARGDIFSSEVPERVATAVAPNTGSFPDRLYAAWPSPTQTSGRKILYFAFSSNRGTTWSKPEIIDPGGANLGAQKFAPMLAVNRAGIVGLAWLDGRNTKNADGYDVYFAASVDGGRSFSRSIRISSATSYPSKGIDALPIPLMYDSSPAFKSTFDKTPNKNEVAMLVQSPFTSRVTGADFHSMAADAAGRFHPLWPDARSGTWQIYTRTIHVGSLQDLGLTVSDPQKSGDFHRCVLSRDIQLIAGIPSWNAALHQTIIPVRLKNLSKAAIQEPLTISVWAVKLDASYGIMTLAWPAARLVTKDGKYAANTTIRYAITRDHPLFPNGVTEEEPWRFYIERPELLNFTMRSELSTTAPLCENRDDKG